MKENSQDNSKSLLLRLWATLASMKFAIWLLIILAFLSVLSLFVSEFLPDNPAASSWAEFVWTKLGQRGMKLLRDIGVTRPFHAAWYRFLIALLAVSLLSCLIQRLPGVLRRLRRGPAALEKSAILELPLHAEITTASRQMLAANWPAKFRRLQQTTEAGELWRGERGQYARLGPPLAHLGMFLLAFGAFLMSLGGRSFEQGGFPGDTVQNPQLPFALRVDSFRVEYYPLAPGQRVLVGKELLGRLLKRSKQGTWLVEIQEQGGVPERVELPEAMLENRFDPEFDSGNIRDYIATVSVLEDGRAVRQAQIEVNHPLRHKGWRIYQSSYEPNQPRITAAFDTMFVEVMRASDSTVVDTVALPFTGGTPILGKYVMQVMSFYPDYRRRASEDYSLSSEMNNPAVRVELLEDGKSLGSTVLFQKFSFHGGFGAKTPFLFRILNITGATATQELRTVFQIRKDQGGSMIWAGFIAVTLGLLLAFYMVHRQLWVWTEPLPDGRVRAVIGADSARGANHFEREFRAIVTRMES
jgi:cytochrome c biogenesis protein